MHSLGPGRARRVGGWPPQGRDGFALFFVEFSFYAKYDLRSQDRTGRNHAGLSPGTHATLKHD